MQLRQTRSGRVDKHSVTCVTQQISYASVLILTDFTVCACPAGPTVALVAVTEVFASADLTGVIFAVTDCSQQTHVTDVNVRVHAKLWQAGYNIRICI